MRVILRSGLLLVLFACVVTPVRAQSCAMSGDGTCSGGCPLLMFCGYVFPGMSQCQCQGGLGPGGGCGAKYMEPIPEEVFSSSLSDASGGPQFLSVGNGISLTQSHAITFEVHHSTAWGGGVQTITLPLSGLSATIRVTGVDANNPNRRTLVVNSLGAVLPSFASVALGGGMTGDNTFSADPDRSGSGWIDTTTGTFHLQLYARLFNGVFQAHPALVQTVVDGSINAATHKVSITGLPSDLQIMASSPDTTLW